MAYTKERLVTFRIQIKRNVKKFITYKSCIKIRWNLQAFVQHVPKLPNSHEHMAAIGERPSLANCQLLNPVHPHWHQAGARRDRGARRAVSFDERLSQSHQEHGHLQQHTRKPGLGTAAKERHFRFVNYKLALLILHLRKKLCCGNSS